MKTSIPAVALVASCIATNPPPPMTAPPSNQSATAQAGLRHGEYMCRIEGYDPFRCIVRDDRGHAYLEKMNGSIRFRGRVTPGGDGGFELQGEIYCAYIDCTEPIRSYFRPTADGFVGQIAQQGNPMTVTIWQPRYDQYGGVSYGGYGYGGHGYGGHGYGGAAYGGYGYGGYR